MNTRIELMRQRRLSTWVTPSESEEWVLGYALPSPSKWRSFYSKVWKKQLHDMRADLARAKSCDVMLCTLWDCSQVLPKRLPNVEVGSRVMGFDEIDESICHNVRAQTYSNMMKYFVWEVETALDRDDSLQLVYGGW